MRLFAPHQGPKTEPSSAVGTAVRKLARFHQEEDGVFVAFSLFVMLIILSVSGIGVDTMRFEMERTRLQNTIDRAVLAAANLDQSLTPKAVVEDYFVKAGITNVVPVVDPKTGVGYKSVNAKASKVIKTQFMHMSGVDTLTIPAEATAEERVPKVEISLVVDISGSMKDNSRLTNLKDAAEIFVNSVINPSTTNRVSVNFIPYSEHVNVGPDIMKELNVNQVHNYSHCIEFDNSDFDSAALNKSKTYQQMQHYQWNYYSIESGYAQNTRYDTVCPRYNYERVTVMSQNATALINQIKALKPRAGTQIFLGMKWAAAMLDPSFQTINAKLATLGKSDNNFNTRPAAHTDSKTLKTIVLMTDGENSSTQRINSQVYANSSHYAHWDNYNFNYYLSNYVYSNQRLYWYWQKYSATTGDSLLQDICDAAKDKGIVIWTVGFETTTHGEDEMRECASSPSHYFDVEGLQIKDAFQSIARQINQLRLTQ